MQGCNEKGEDFNANHYSTLCSFRCDSVATIAKTEHSSQSRMILLLPTVAHTLAFHVPRELYRATLLVCVGSNTIIVLVHVH